MEFNQVFKYSLFAFFSWDMLSVSSLLVTIQFELVEYKFPNDLRNASHADEIVSNTNLFLYFCHLVFLSG